MNTVCHNRSIQCSLVTEIIVVLTLDIVYELNAQILSLSEVLCMFLKLFCMN